MTVKNYLINDKWLDLDKQNIVEVKSTDGVIESVKLNGEEYGGGGGSSDFSTATVTFNSNTTGTIPLMLPVATEEGVDIDLSVRNGRTLELPLYNGSCIVSPNENFKGDDLTDFFTVTGDIRIDAENSYIIVSGDGTITYTPAP